MSFKRTMRSFAAISRQIERDNKRRNRIAAQQYKQLQKQQAITDARQVVADYNNYINVIKSVHNDCSTEIDWESIRQEGAPAPPLVSTEHERSAQEALDSYQPSFLDRLFKRQPVKIRRLEDAVLTARHKDEQLTRERQEEHIQLTTEWQERQEISRQVLAKDSNVYAQVIEYFAPFEDISQLGSKLVFTFTADHIEVDVEVDTAEVVPDFVVTQLASGKLSRKPLSASKFNEIYQDYVCSCLLRVAREIQAHLPVSQVVVHALVNQLNSATGQIENQVVVSAAMPRETLSKLNFSTIDPSDSMRNFNHTMKFTKTGGFQEVNRVGLSTLPSFGRQRNY
ncbi:hypothetical protein M0L20_29575 [Spirosoma sp. RP8]|uniref:Uncharacterized protein n=1 Tax=Spirosoma liriopis TaxID=2937440 RepID=A0ABT0HV17_9BACT|nr:hypothetical protein [Spirosoma liriopis]MCK8496053.1 hypothetical protein [Spirosoma liriopis]